MKSTHIERVITASIIITITALLISGTVVVTQKNKSNIVGASSNTVHKKVTVVTVARPKISSPPSLYKDGTYQATGAYESPGGSQDITLSVTLQSGVITNTGAQGDSHSDDSQIYQANFIAGYKQKVVGKNISDVYLSQVGGSSLTSIGFNSALDKIKNQAKV